ncbi:CPXCG motif-containing cysteine-rich protein [Sedimenticola sp.]|uniref:CPXCG motif-containing cysteine-rich protein n=1 Tax=Sedimenticola sp. TaxID=1940285 RepID=UPI0025893528|nr:CPXCG motif-containing cysteine-rich protein [Sedimenticola sp.]MCW8905411.1 CPXCG motif-containing cysteine-rich protein [Sedimenticola sp.]
MDLIQQRTVNCPYCGEPQVLLLDCSVAEQEYIEDCQVCCCPIIVNLNCDDPADLFLSVRREND